MRWLTNCRNAKNAKERNHEFDFSSSFNLTFLARIGITLIHSLWQIALLAVVFKVFLISTNQRDARARYWGAMLFLLVAIVIPTTTFFAYTNTSIADASNPQAVVGVLTGDNHSERNNLTGPPIEQSASVEIPADAASSPDAIRESSLPPINHRETGATFIEVAQSSRGSILARLNSIAVQFSPWVHAVPGYWVYWCFRFVRALVLFRSFA